MSVSCPICDKTFANKYSMTSHKSRYHNGNKSKDSRSMIDVQKDETISVKSTTDSIESQGSSAKENDLEDDDTSNDSNSNYDENSTRNEENSSDNTDEDEGKYFEQEDNTKSDSSININNVKDETLNKESSSNTDTYIKHLMSYLTFITNFLLILFTVLKFNLSYFRWKNKLHQSRKL